jgi:membrane-bound lytic murein transglycosylase A
VRRLILVFMGVVFLSACAARVEKPAPRPLPPPLARPVPSPPEALPKPLAPLVRLPAEQFPEFADDMDLASLERAMDKSLSYYDRVKGNAPHPLGDALVSIQEQRDTLAALREILRSGETEEGQRRRIAATFDVYRSTGRDGKNTVLFTGYFEPILRGSRTAAGPYRYPVYRPPADAIRVSLGKFREDWKNEQLVGRVHNGELIPYHSRGEIEEQGVLAGRGLEIAWVDDRIDLFFLHIQGSGKVRLPDGSLLQIGYAGRNGRPYRSLARFLVDSGRIGPQEISYPAIKGYLRNNPGELPEILGHNESFIFFREVREGPVGSLGEVLTAGRSIATDPAFFPRGALAFIRLRKPVFDDRGEIAAWVPFSRFVLNQDAGGAIKGAGRVDIFCGTGEAAEQIAGSFKERGELYFLVKKRRDALPVPGEAAAP